MPSSLEIDLYDGQAYVGVVPFAMRQIRPSWCPAALGFNFLELNVRTYVHNGRQAGVFFFSLDANSALAVWIAKTFWGLPYISASMSMRQTSDDKGEGIEFSYGSRRKADAANFACEYRVLSEPGVAEIGGLEYFFLERYLLFTELRGGIKIGQVHHTPYPFVGAEVKSIDQDLLAFHGLGDDWGPPSYAHFSPGVDVEVFPLR